METLLYIDMTNILKNKYRKKSWQITRKHYILVCDDLCSWFLPFRLSTYCTHVIHGLILYSVAILIVVFSCICWRRENFFVQVCTVCQKWEKSALNRRIFWKKKHGEKYPYSIYAQPISRVGSGYLEPSLILIVNCILSFSNLPKIYNDAMEKS